MKKHPFDIVFEPTNQPGWESRYGGSARRIVGKDSIVGSGPKDNPQPYTASQVLEDRQNLEGFFVTMQVPQLMPSKLRRREK